ncbi:tyrosine-protein phosphatase [Gordonia soli]|nr:tyrosine-protein phosphatase [Gordonia soli]
MTTRLTPAYRRAATPVSVLAIAAALAVGSPVVGTAAATPAPPPASTPTPVAASPQPVDLVGTDNSRTFANYRTTGGRVLRDSIIRSDNLSKLTAADQQTLRDRGVRTIIDLRTTAEQAIQPDRPVSGAQIRRFDVLGRTPVTTLVDLPAAYRAFVTDPGARQAFRDTLLTVRDTIDGGGQVLFHCTAGKDRTGWAAALLLGIAGVDRATIERDYLASNTFRHTGPADPVNGVSAGLLRSSYAAADSVYGGLDGYLKRGLRLSEADITAIRDAITAPVGIANFVGRR